MSFSSGVRNEVCKIFTDSRHCNISELAAFINYSANFDVSFIDFMELNPIIKNKLTTILKLLFKENFDVISKDKNLCLRKSDIVKDILLSTGLSCGKKIDPILVKKDCCKKSYLRGAFINIGSVVDPNKNYHLEFVLNDLKDAEELRDLINTFSLNSKIIERSKKYVVYLKDSESIVDLLNIIGAHKSLLEFENIRVLKDLRNKTNRTVNFETANIEKTAKASYQQCEDILFIKEKKGLSYLPENLKQVSEIRLMYPDYTLKELGEALTPKISKSGVNHRLKKINEIADGIRGGLL